MNDTLSLKVASFSAIVDGTIFPDNAYDYARVVSSDPRNHLRRCDGVEANSVDHLGVAHQPRKRTSDDQRSLIFLDRTLDRVDASDIVIRTDKLRLAFQATIGPNITEAEFIAASESLIGALIRTNGALLRSFYKGEY